MFFRLGLNNAAFWTASGAIRQEQSKKTSVIFNDFPYLYYG